MSDTLISRCWKEIGSGRPQCAYKDWNEIYNIVDASEEEVVVIHMENEFIDNLLVKNTYAHYGGSVFLSPSYIRYSGKKDIQILWGESR